MYMPKMIQTWLTIPTRRVEVVAMVAMVAMVHKHFLAHPG
jgi:hypothetical protein